MAHMRAVSQAKTDEMAYRGNTRAVGQEPVAIVGQESDQTLDPQAIAWVRPRLSTTPEKAIKKIRAIRRGARRWKTLA
jgi:hypothetical protein